MNDPGILRALSWVVRRPGWILIRTAILLGAYSAVLCLSRWLAYQFRFDFAVPEEYQTQLARHWLWVLCLKLVALAAFRQFSGLVRYFSIPDLHRLALATLCSAVALLSVWFIAGSYYAPPRGVILLDAILSFGGIAGLRLGYRVFCEQRSRLAGGSRRIVQHAAIVGAGDVGSSLIKELSARPGLALKPLIIVDDDPQKWNSTLHGVPIVGPPEALTQWVRELNLTQLILAMPSAPAKRVGEIAALARRLGLHCVVVPAIDQLASGQVSVSQLRPVSVADLLGREAVNLEVEAIRRTFEGRVVMVTGAGGSIGSELCRQVAALNPRRLLLVEQCEVQLFQIEQEMIVRGHRGLIVPLIADVLDEERMRNILAAYQPALVLHAAAHKHVPLMEEQPGEAIKNNTLATARLAELALAARVERFLLISTDKAVNPTSVMGASKRLAEIQLQALAAARRGPTRFMAVRFGNVLGSSGSVVPTFTRQIAQGGPVTVTHPEMTRYFMTIPEAVGLVLQSCAQGQGGEIFVLDMGRPVRIADLARNMIELSGLQPDVDIEIQYTGLRPGEKLFEEINRDTENHRPTAHPRILSFVSEPWSWPAACAAQEQLRAALHQDSEAALKLLIQRLVPEYGPNGNAVVGRPLPASVMDAQLPTEPRERRVAYEAPAPA